MNKVELTILAVCGLAMVGCSGEPGQEGIEGSSASDLEQEIITAHLEEQGYDVSSLVFHEDKVIVEGDKVISRVSLLESEGTFYEEGDLQVPEEVDPDSELTTEPQLSFGQLEQELVSDFRPSALPCSFGGNQFCANVGAVCDRVWTSAVEDRRQLCRWPGIRTETHCHTATAGIWTLAGSSFDRNAPGAVPPGQPAACTTQIANLRCSSTEAALCRELLGRYHKADHNSFEIRDEGINPETINGFLVAAGLDPIDDFAIGTDGNAVLGKKRCTEGRLGRRLCVQRLGFLHWKVELEPVPKKE